MTVRTLAGLAGAAAILVLGACAEESSQQQDVAMTPAPVCETLPGVYARVADSRAVHYSGAFDPGYVAVTDTTAITSGEPNVMQYALVTEDGRRLPLVSRDTYQQGDQLYVEADTCNRAHVTVIQALG